MHNDIQPRETAILSATQTRPSSSAASRGSGAEHISIQQRVIALKIDIDWKSEESRAMYNRLRDLSWQAARYRNGFIRRLWAEAMGWRVDPNRQDKHDVTKQGRQTEKASLSGAAYSAAEREVAGAWARDAKHVLAGQPLPEWKPNAALSIRGNKNRKESGVRLELEGGRYVAYIQAQSKDCDGGSWLRVPIARHTLRDEYQSDVINAMVAWTVPILKATIQVKRSAAILRLTFAREIKLPRMGERIATLGPVTGEGRLLLRAELQTKDYTSKLVDLLKKKDSWDLIRRRVTAQIGRKKGHARAKRERLALMTWDDWLSSHLHQWTRQIIDWCETQGVGTIRVHSVDTGDWPAYRFVQMLRYKAADAGMAVEEGADIQEPGGLRAVTAPAKKRQRTTKKAREAVRELLHQFA